MFYNKKDIFIAFIAIYSFLDTYKKLVYVLYKVIYNVI